MSKPQHRQIGIYPSHDAARRALEELRAGGVPAPRLHLLHQGVVYRARPHPQSQGGLAEQLVGGAMAGALSGALMGGGMLALVALGSEGASPSGLLALPLIGVSVGGLGGALLNAAKPLFGAGARIRRALARGQVVLVVHPRDADEGRRARQLMRTPLR